jgi:DNA-binding beta-propeller fold protein YncE
VQAFKLPSMELAWQFGSTRTKGEKDIGLNQPRAVRLSRDGKFVYVADCYNDRIVKLNAADGSFVEQLGGPRGNAIPLLRPQGVSVSDTTDSWVWIADTHNQRVICIDTSLQPPAVVLQVGGTKGPGDNQFRFPTGITTFEGRVFVADSLNKRVQVCFSFQTFFAR